MEFGTTSMTTRWNELKSSMRRAWKNLNHEADSEDDSKTLEKAVKRKLDETRSNSKAEVDEVVAETRRDLEEKISSEDRRNSPDPSLAHDRRFQLRPF